MTRSELPGLVSKAVILWDERIRCEYRDHEVRKLRNRFAAHVYRAFPRDAAMVSRTNLDLGFDWLLTEAPTLAQWYRTLLGEENESPVRYRAGQVSIDPARIDGWEALCGHFEPDALLTFSIARRNRGHEPDFAKWKTIARAENKPLAKIFKRGLSDLHVHVSGVRLPHAAWHDIVHGRAPVGVFRVLSGIYREAGRDFADDVDEIRTLRSDLERELSISPARLGPVPLTGTWWQWSSSLLAPERELLLRAWRACLQSKPDAATLRAFDRYLWHKHRFFGLVRQASMPTEPGLRQFELHYFSALKRDHPRSRAWTRQLPSYASSPRLTMRPEGDACQYLLESATLRKIELRISPFERASDYPKFFRLWEKLKKQIECDLRQKGRKMPQLRFAVHFRRSLARPPDPRSGGDPDELLKLRGLDRATAALRLALNNEGPHRSRMRWLARIDVAGQERDTATSVFIFHLRLLRGDAVALQELEEMPADDPRRRWLGRWISLKERGEHRPRDCGDLGMTIHAGEDYADPLDGLYQVGVAVNALKLGNGDCIGHALALSDRIQDAAADPFVIQPLGEVFDSLCWLLDMLDPHYHEIVGKGTHQRLTDMIGRTAHKIYDGIVAEVDGAAVSDHVAVWRHTLLLNDPGKRLEDLRGALWRRRWDAAVLRSRARTMPAPFNRSDLGALLKEAQSLLLHQITSRGIIIEMNPSSNLRITGVRRAGDLPTARLLERVEHGLHACINTDNPGVFTTCIENEYALLLHATTDSRIDKSLALGWLERARHVGMNVMRWEPASKRDVDR